MHEQRVDTMPATCCCSLLQADAFGSEEVVFEVVEVFTGVVVVTLGVVVTIEVFPLVVVARLIFALAVVHATGYFCVQ